MKTGLKRGLAVGLGVCMAASMLAGCGKKETLDTAAVAATFDGEEISAGLVNFYLRYQQAEFESSYGSWLSSYYGTNIWDADLTGTGVAYGETFKDDVMTSLERLLLAEKHMADYSVELTDEEKAAITQAAQDFMAANDEEVLEKMSATQENVERILTLSTIQNKVETGMVADVDTEVSDEEAAQRTVSYVRFTAETESDTEAETESGSEAQTEGASEAETAGEMETEGETEAETAGETETEAAAETETEAEDATEAALTEAEGTKTQAADEETESEAAETEADTEEVTEAAEEETQEQDADTEAEAATEAETETETETEDPAMEAAREEARAQAEAFLEQVKGGEDFETAAAAAAEENENVGTSDFTFGDNDTYPDEAIIEATKGLEDGTLVEEPVQVNDAFYVLYVDDAFDEEATEEEKDNIVTQRKSDAINALYEEWMEDVEFTVNDEVYDEMLFDLSLTLETEAVTEAETEAASESQSEAETEAASEAETEAASEAETEAVSESQSETETEAVSESQSEEVTEEAAEASADAEAETEAETQTEEVTEAETETEEVTEA